MEIEGKKKFVGSIRVPGDKSISHRAIILSAISDKKVEIENILLSEDVLVTINAFRDMGIEINIDEENNRVVVMGKGLKGLKKPKKPIYCGNSGTTMRLLSGILAGQKFESVLIGDDSLNSRPMDRVEKPLKLMGANINSNNGKAPLKIYPSNLNSIEYHMPVDSAQVKSAILLASLYTEDKSKVFENNPSRDHTELMLKFFEENRDNRDLKIFVPGDFSSAAYFIVGSLINEGSKLKIENVGLNPTRTGLLKILRKMGGKIKIKNERKLNKEIVGDITIQYSKLKGVHINREDIPTLIDEIPILSVAFLYASGISSVSGAEELRVKESDRIKALVMELSKFGANIKEKKDGFIIEGLYNLHPTKAYSHKDHRVAMTLGILASSIKGKTKIFGDDIVKISYPNFFDILNSENFDFSKN